jgi:hypothetical protein
MSNQNLQIQPAIPGDVITLNVQGIVPPPPVVTSITVTGPGLVSENGTAQYAAAVKGTGNFDASVVWSCSDGTITPTGLFTAPAKVENVTITATSVQTPAVNGSLPVSIALPSNTVKIFPSGRNDTSAMQAALNTTAAAGQILEITPGTYHLSPVWFPSNSNVLVDAGVILDANAGYGSGDCMLNVNAKNTSIQGAGAAVSIAQMPKVFAVGTQYQHALAIRNATNPIIKGMGFNQAGGDGIYILASVNVEIDDCSCNANFRNGLSLISVNKLRINRCGFNRSTGLRAINDGADCEPNNETDNIIDAIFTDCTADGNDFDGFGFSLGNLTGRSQCQITFIRCKASNSKRYDWFMQNRENGDTPQGTVTLNDCSSDHSGASGFIGRFWQNGPLALVLNNPTVNNPQQKGNDPAYGFSAGVANPQGGGAAKPGNMHVSGATIISTDGKMVDYLHFDGASDTFSGAKQLSGATNPNAKTSYP